MWYLTTDIVLFKHPRYIRTPRINEETRANRSQKICAISGEIGDYKNHFTTGPDSSRPLSTDDFSFGLWTGPDEVDGKTYRAIGRPRSRARICIKRATN